MKLVIVGATGFVATEVIRQALSLPKVTSIIALARNPISPPANLKPGANVSKLTSIVTDTLDSYSQDVREALTDVDACIWTPSIGPLIAQKHTIEEIKHINNDLPLLCLKTLHSLRSPSTSTSPLRFLFMSGYSAIRSPSPTTSPDDPALPFMQQYRQIRGHAETLLSSYATAATAAASTIGAGVEVCSVRPGIITENGILRLKVTTPEMQEFVRVTPKVDVDVVAAALLEGVLRGVGVLGDPAVHERIVEVGEKLVGRARAAG